MTANPSSDAAYLPFTVEDSAQFSLEDDDLLQPTTTEHQQRQNLLGNDGTAASSPTSSSSCAFDSATRPFPEAGTQRFPRWRDKLTSNREASRLTDEIELDDADSGSDDLDLLPPMAPNGATTTAAKNCKRKFQKYFPCCFSPNYVPSKCCIL